jgi:hypothetical protein
MRQVIGCANAAAFRAQGVWLRPLIAGKNEGSRNRPAAWNLRNVQKEECLAASFG